MYRTLNPEGTILNTSFLSNFYSVLYGMKITVEHFKEIRRVPPGENSKIRSKMSVLIVDNNVYLS